MWQKVFSAPGNYDETVKDAVIDHRGNLLITGEQFSSSTYSDILVVKYSASGTLRGQIPSTVSGHGFDSVIQFVWTTPTIIMWVRCSFKRLILCGNLTKYTPAGLRVYNMDIPAIGSFRMVLITRMDFSTLTQQHM
ncbi:MAG: hypothetical protein U0X76_00030 [Bacteroidia bacterium]